MLEPLREPVADRVLEGRLAQNRRVDEASEHRLPRARLLGLAPDLGPDRVETLDVRIVEPGLLHWFSPVSIDAAHGGATALSQLKSVPTSARRGPFSAVSASFDSFLIASAMVVRSSTSRTCSATRANTRLTSQLSSL